MRPGISLRPVLDSRGRGSGTSSPTCRPSSPTICKTNATLTGLAMTKDFKTWIRAGWLTDPLLDDRDVILFPEKIGGRFAMLRRPLEWVGPALRHRRGLRVDQLRRRPDGPGPCPGQAGAEEQVSFLGSLEDGLQHAADQDAARLVRDLSCRGGRQDSIAWGPCCWTWTIRRSSATARRTGSCRPRPITRSRAIIRGVCFPCGAVVVDGTLMVYYGGADKYCALATCDFDAMIAAPAEAARALTRTGTPMDVHASRRSRSSSFSTCC